MTTKVFESSARGKADFGWLKANFSFSFRNYINPERFQFGMLRVLNDDTIEMRAKKREQKRLLWVFPDKVNVNQRYDQKSFDIENQNNTFVNIVCPKEINDGNALGVHQQTFFNLGIFEKDEIITYKINMPENGLCLFQIEGEIEVYNHILKPRDAMGITDFDQFEIKINSKAKILLVEVPMQ